MAPMTILQTPPMDKAQPKHSLAFDVCSPMCPVNTKSSKAVQTPCAFLPASGWLWHSSPQGGKLMGASR